MIREIKPARKFLGKTSEFIDKQEKVFHERMLRAYLKGKEYFNFGFTTNSFGMRVPETHKVLQEYY